MKRSKCLIVMSILVIVIGVQSLKNAYARTGNDDLFIPAINFTLNISQPADTQLDPSIVRSRDVIINSDLLSDAASVTLNMFDDLTLTTLRQRVEKRSDNYE